MKLLVTTQVVNKNDTNLGFFHEWLRRLSAKVDKLTVICLYKGEFDLPGVEVISLGKEKGRVSSLVYALRFYKTLWQLRGQYDSVFVHMNPEYAILGGPIWRLTGKKVLLWYVHKAVNLRRLLAQVFVTKVFSTSKGSFRWPRFKLEIVGHGSPDVALNYLDIKENKGLAGGLSLLSVGRISPVKRLEVGIKAVEILRSKKLKNLNWIQYNIAGATLSKKELVYRDRLQEMSQRIMRDYKNTPTGITFTSYPQDQIFNVYQNSHLLVHLSDTGSFDKVVLEALSVGHPVITTSEAYKSLAEGELKDVVFYCRPGDPEQLAKAIEKIWEYGILQKIPIERAIVYVKKNHNLDNLVDKIIGYYKK